MIALRIWGFMLRARAKLNGYPLFIFGLSDGNMRKLQERKPMFFDLKPEFGTEAAVLIMWGPTEQAIQEDIEKNGLPIRGREIQPAPDVGPTGEYPGGKLHKHDRGEVRFAVSSDPATGHVILDFGTELKWLAVGRGEALALAHALIDHAGRLGDA